jgi:predicted SprT family Zn-dependent metalloprotease
MKQEAKVDDPQSGQIWFVRFPDNHWELAKVQKITGVLADVVYGDKTKERFNIKRYADAIVLASDKVKFSDKSYTSAQVTKLAAHEVADDDPDWMQAQTEANPQDQLRYIRKMWKTYNAELFQNKLKPVAIKLMVVKAKARGLGVFTYNRGFVTNSITISPRVFMAGKEVFRTTLVHEMCHQYCVDVLNLQGEGHGVNWQRTMRMAGLKPDRLAMLDDDVIVDDEKLDQIQQNKEQVKKSVNDYGTMSYPRADCIVGWQNRDTGQLEKGVLVSPATKDGKNWAVATSAYGSNFRNVPTSIMLNTEYGDRRWQDISAYENYARIVDLIRQYFQRKLGR